MKDISDKEQFLQEKLNKLNIELERIQKEFKEQIQRKDEECNLKLVEIQGKYKIKEDILVQRLKKNESMFQKELNTQIQMIKQSWSWRIINLLIVPIEICKKLSFPVFHAFSGLKKMLSSKSLKRSGGIADIDNFDFENQITNSDNVNIASIFDIFTETCFSTEFNIVRFSPNNWKKVLESIPVEGFFMESAWNGIGGAWRNKVVNISLYNQRDLFKLISWVKEKHIPTIFWNKEDPVHFDEFLGVAKEFDFIFTTDADCIPDYRQASGHSNVFALPFAAQPNIHNPVRDESRSGSVCFAGTYYNKKYAERRTDLDFLLKPALEFGLDIYDRHYGSAAQRAGIYGFPDIYQSNIKGRLDYDDMVKAYKNYKVFLNVNSVRYSPTMFARRVFELLACGTPVISTYSHGITNLLGEDTVLISESEDDTRKHLESLIHDNDFWWKKSLAGLRKVMKFHTYNERVCEVFKIAGLPFNQYRWSSFCVISNVKTYAEIRFLKEMLDSQVYREFEVILLESNESVLNEEERRLAGQSFGTQLRGIITGEIEKWGEMAGELNRCDYLAFINPACYYGKNYLQDYALAARYANPGIMGKKSYFEVKTNQLSLINAGNEYTHTSSAPNGSIVIHNLKLGEFTFNSWLNIGSFSSDKKEILSIDPYNFIQSENFAVISDLDKAFIQKVEI